MTFVGAPQAVASGAFAGVQVTQQHISLVEHRGVHPRIGATDVLPFVPLRGCTMADCIRLAHQVGRQIGNELNIPVYLYGEAATRPERYSLAALRRGGYEGLRALIEQDPQRAPDFGPAVLGPAGATAVGARPILIAYNVYLNTADRRIAHAVARTVRWSSGGLPHVQALGLLVGGQAQVSMNLTDYRSTSLLTVWRAIEAVSDRYGVMPVRSEVVGLIPADALPQNVVSILRLGPDIAEHILERRLPAGVADLTTVASATPGEI